MDSRPWLRDFISNQNHRPSSPRKENCLPGTFCAFFFILSVPDPSPINIRPPDSPSPSPNVFERRRATLSVPDRENFKASKLQSLKISKLQNTKTSKPRTSKFQSPKTSKLRGEHLGNFTGYFTGSRDFISPPSAPSPFLSPVPLRGGHRSGNVYLYPRPCPLATRGIPGRGSGSLFEIHAMGPRS